MAILNSRRRISPLDLDNNVKIGVAFPLDSKNMFSGTEKIAEQNKTNLINLLLTEPGERIGGPSEIRFGVGLQRLLFENNVNTDQLKENIMRQAQIYIPQITIINVRVSSGEPNEHTVYIVISYRSNLDGNVDSIQLNFN